MSALIQTLRLLILVILLFTASGNAQAPNDSRVALVIGNAAYLGHASLANPVNDAKAISEALRGMGFEIVELHNGSKAQMEAAIAQVHNALNDKYGVGLLYYAGHGLQVDARNFMVPVDASLRKTADIPEQTVDVYSVMKAFQSAGNRLNILVLDACRDNPFGSINTGKGLAPLDAPTNSFLAYSTAPGNVAEDGDASLGNGLYTHYLLQELEKQNVRIEDVFKRVRFAVRKASSGRQIPWESTSLEDDFHFSKKEISIAPKPTAQQLQRQFSEEKQEWDRIKDSNNPDDFYAFLQKYPNGTISEAADIRLNMLTKPTMVVQGASADGSDQSYTLTRYRLGDEYETRDSDSSEPGFYKVLHRVVSVQNEEFEVETVRADNPARRFVRIFNSQGGWLGIKDGFRINPPKEIFPAGLLQIGYRWKQTYQTELMIPNVPNAPPTIKHAKVSAREKVTVPAGTFDTFRIDSYEVHSPESPIKKSACTIWVVPELPMPVKLTCTIDKYDSGSSNISSDVNTRELVRFTRGSA